MVVSFNAMDTEHVQLQHLKSLCVALAQNPNFVYGSGGNVSIKLGDVLWVKASGTWLADAQVKEIFVPLNLAALRTGIAQKSAEYETIIQGAITSKITLRPSIETLLHAALLKKIVLHLHSINSVTISILTAANSLVKRALYGKFNYAILPYISPGMDLAHAINLASRENANLEVIVLKNHGIIVCADTIERAKEILEEVEACFGLVLNQNVETCCTSNCKEIDNFEKVATEQILRSNPVSIRLFENCAYLPDQIVFIDGKVQIFESYKELCRLPNSVAIQTSLVIIKDAGFYVRNNCNQGTTAIIISLLKVARRLPNKARLSKLPFKEIDKLRNWEAEKYRQIMDIKRDKEA